MLPALEPDPLGLAEAVSAPEGDTVMFPPLALPAVAAAPVAGFVWKTWIPIRPEPLLLAVTVTGPVALPVLPTGFGKVMAERMALGFVSPMKLNEATSWPCGLYRLILVWESKESRERWLFRSSGIELIGSLVKKAPPPS